jgi:hypothetical protein
MATAAGDPIRATDDDVITQASSAKPLCRLIQTVAQGIPTATASAITFAAASEDIDTNGWHDTVTNNTRITPNIAGYYRINGGYASATITLSAAQEIDAAIAKNGTSVPSGNWVPGVVTAANVMVTADCIQSANGTTDFFEIKANQTSGGTVNTNLSGRLTSFLEVEFLRPL